MTGGALGALDGATGWLNSAPLTAADLRGRVVLVDFWTFTCINWLRSLPYVRAWHERYARHGLVVVGVHTPEFDVEGALGNVRQEADRLRVGYPIAVDTAYAVWDGFGNRYWPALYLVDATGEIRHHRFGEGDYERTERVIRQLLTEAGARDLGDGLTTVDGDGVEAAADWNHLRSPETYLGYQRASADGNWSLDGAWAQGPQAAVLEEGEGRITYRFHARDLHLVLAPAVPGKPVRFRVRIDGEPAGAAAGADVTEGDGGTVTEPRLYQLVRQRGRITDRTFEITFTEPGVRAYAFTFG